MAKPGAEFRKITNVRKKRNKTNTKALKTGAKTAKGCLGASMGCLFAPFTIFIPNKKKRR